MNESRITTRRDAQVPPGGGGGGGAPLQLAALAAQVVTWLAVSTVGFTYVTPHLPFVRRRHTQGAAGRKPVPPAR